MDALTHTKPPMGKAGTVKGSGLFLFPGSRLFPRGFGCEEHSRRQEST